MMGVFSEFERSMIVERVKAGLSRARAQGKRLGRRPLDIAMEAKVRGLRAQDKDMIKIAKEIGIGVGTVKRVVDTLAVA
jgi:DNA invertase Pin-like site-specific DNA recombinase